MPAETSAAMDGVAAGQAAIALQAAHQALVSQCKATIPNFDAQRATVSEMREYADCVETLYPTEIGADATVALKVLFVVALAALQKIKDVATSQLIAPVAILSVAMIVLHLIGAASHERYGVGDVIEAAWRIVDMLAILSLIRLTKLVQ